VGKSEIGIRSHGKIVDVLCSALKRYSESESRKAVENDKGNKPEGKKNEPQKPTIDDEKKNVKKVEEEEASVPENRVRVVAYSDSDSDVESHFQRVKTHLLPAIDSLDIKPDVKSKGGKNEEKQEETKGEEVVEAGQKRSLSRLVGGFGAIFGKVFPMSTVYRSVAIFLIHRANPMVGYSIEGVTGLLAMAGILRRKSFLSPTKAPSLSESKLGFFSYQADQIARAAILYEIYQQILRRVVRRSGLVKLSSEVDLVLLEQGERIELDKPPETAEEFAAVHGPEMKEMRRILDSCEIELPDRFSSSNAELFRFARACGILDAETAEEKGVCIEKAVKRLINTSESLSNFELMKESRLKKWERLVSWRGTDVHGCPILVVRLGRALQLCTKSEQLTRFSLAIKTQIEIGVVERTVGSAERIVCVIDCREVTAWDAISNSRQISTLAKDLVSFLALNYPERLEKVYLLDAALLSRMISSSVLSSLQQRTKDKVVFTTSDSELLPITVATLQKSRSYAAGLPSVMSDLSLATSAGSTPRGEEQQLEEASDAPRSDEKSGSEEWLTPGKELYKPLAAGSEETEVDPESATTSPDMPFGSHALKATPFIERDRFFSTQTSIDTTDLSLYVQSYPWGSLELFMSMILATPKLRMRKAVSPSTKLMDAALAFGKTDQKLIKGGVLALPERIIKHKNSPRPPPKSSLRREESFEDGPGRVALGSFPLPRQASVSWAENLELVQEIRADGQLQEEHFKEMTRYFLVALLLTGRIFYKIFL